MNSGLICLISLIILIVVAGLPILLVYFYRRGNKKTVLTISFIVVSFFLFIFYILTNQTGLEPTIADLGNGYFIAHNSMDDKAVVNQVTDVSRKYIVHGHVVGYVFDSTFILVAEKPRDSVIKTTLILSIKEAQKVLNQSRFRQYYIINKKQDSLYGPYKIDAFIVKRKELNVPKNLIIKY